LGGSYGYSGHLIGTATPSYYGWLYSWNTTTVPNGSYLLVSEAFGAAGSAFSSGVGVTVANPGLADLASSSITGTTSSTLTSCSFVGETFNAAYPGSSAVGTVTLQMNGCIPDTGPNFPFTFEYSGTFTVTTGVGTLSGSVAGQITNVNLSPPPEINLVPTSATLTLTATSGTGDFMGTTGTLNVSLQWPEPGSSTFIGTVTPA
jgi:hypothetical protein